MTLREIIKRPAAYVPLCMSLLALAIVVLHLARFGAARQTDEGTSAHLWQLLMAGQMPIIFFFAVKWLPQQTKPALAVLVLQFLAGVAAAAPVFILEW